MKLRRALLNSVRKFAAEMSGAGNAQQTALLEDQCILVNAHDEVVGSNSKLFCHQWSNVACGKALHRAFSVFLFNDEAKLLLQKRSLCKVTFPDCWTNTCCSHPLYTPTELDMSEDAIGVKKAAQRKLDNELGLSPDDVPLNSMHYLTRLLYRAPYDAVWGEHELDYCVIVQSNAQPIPNPEEVSEVKYVDQDTLRKMLKTEGVKFSPWFVMIAENFLFKWWSNLHCLDKVKDHSRIYTFDDNGSLITA